MVILYLRFKIKNKKNKKSNIGGSFLKVRGTHFLKSGQLVKRENARAILNNIPKGKPQNMTGKRFKPIFRGNNHGELQFIQLLNIHFI